MQNEECRKTDKACASRPIDPEFALCPECPAPCCRAASPGNSGGLKLGTPPFLAQSHWMTGLSGSGRQASLGEGIDTWMWMVSTFLD